MEVASSRRVDVLDDEVSLFQAKALSLMRFFSLGVRLGFSVSDLSFCFSFSI